MFFGEPILFILVNKYEFLRKQKFCIVTAKLTHDVAPMLTKIE